ncbi:MAG: hypothetical protein NT121_24100, partial [Chloroflexi bacterium]|nr:hypothetical protein [Chloroflexota bacterium]
DGALDAVDAFPLDKNESLDTDQDGLGNNADTDDDNDGVLDTADACLTVAGLASNNGCPVLPTLPSTTFGIGGATDDNTPGTPAALPVVVPPAALGIIPVTGGQLTTLSCTDTPTTLMQSGFQVALASLCGYSTIVDQTVEVSMPGNLPDSNSFVGGINLTILQDGNPVNVLPDGAIIILSFEIPAGMSGESLALLYWDSAAGAWVEKSATVEDGKLVAFNIEAPGTFVVVNKKVTAQTDPQPVTGSSDFYSLVAAWLKELAQLFGAH